MMPTTGFEPAKGKRFTFQTTPAGAWDGVIHCEVLEVTPNERLVYSWQGGHEGNVGYGSRLDTVVTWTLARVENGTRLRLVHSGFVLPKNDAAFKNMSEGWKKVVGRIGALSGEQTERAFPIRDDRHHRDAEMTGDDMEKIAVWGFRWAPPFAQGLVRDLRVRWALEEAGLAYESRLIGFEERTSDAYRRYNPFAMVPVLKSGGETVIELGAIVYSIAEDA